MWAGALGISGVNFCQGIRFWEVNFARALGFFAIFYKKCVIFYKSEKRGLLAEDFRFWHSKSHENLPSH